jgi:pyrroloquinoline quinone biosynthesis protein D
MIDPATCHPRLARGVRLHHDLVRARVVLLAPERVLALNASAIEVLRRCDGGRSLHAIACELSQLHNAPLSVIETDTQTLVAGLAERRMVEL